MSDVEDGGLSGGEPTEPDQPSAERPTPLTQQLGRVALVVVAVLFVVFALANAQFVDFSWLVGETRVTERGGERVSGGVPLIVLLVVSFAAGALVASLLSWQRHRRH